MRYAALEVWYLPKEDELYLWDPDHCWVETRSSIFEGFSFEEVFERNAVYICELEN